MWLKTQQITSDQIKTVFDSNTTGSASLLCFIRSSCSAAAVYFLPLSLSLEGLNTFIMHSTGLLSLKSGYKHQNLRVYPDAIH